MTLSSRTVQVFDHQSFFSTLYMIIFLCQSTTRVPTLLDDLVRSMSESNQIPDQLAFQYAAWSPTGDSLVSPSSSG